MDNYKINKVMSKQANLIPNCARHTTKHIEARKCSYYTIYIITRIIKL